MKWRFGVGVLYVISEKKEEEEEAKLIIFSSSLKYKYKNLIRKR
jgi:hypothetical protein